MENKKTRLAVVAGFNELGICDEFLTFYLKKLSLTHDIILVMDNELSNSSRLTASKYCICVISYKHGMYDFGSYKIGYEYARSSNLLGGYTDLLFTNDSIIGPVFNLNDIINKFSHRKDIDFWGLYLNKSRSDEDKSPHIQSYFISFKPNVFMSKTFETFIGNVEKLESKDDIVNKYEIGLTQCLVGEGYKYDFFIGLDKDETVTIYSILLIKYGFPFVKKSLFKTNLIVKCFGLILLSEYVGKDVKLLLKRYNASISFFTPLKFFMKKLKNKVDIILS